MVSIMLDLKIEALTDGDTSEIIKRELQKDLNIFSKKLSDKASKIIKERNRIKIYSQGA